MKTRRQFLHSATSLLAVAALAAGAPAQAGSYPTRPITIIIPFPPGGNMELVARFIADRLPSALGQPVVIEHRPGGAGGTVGAKAVASAEADGHTLLFSSPSPLAVAPAVYLNLGYDPAKSFIPIATAFDIPQMLVVHPSIPVKSLQGLVAHAKANPGRMNFASPGYGTQPHLLGEMLKLSAGIDIVHIPYKGPALAITDLLAGQVQVYFETVGLLLPHVETGKLKALAIADQSRHPQLDGVPTTVESGFPTLQASFWAGLVAPTGTSPSIVQRLNSAINEILKSAELQASLSKLGGKTKIGSPQDFARFIAAEREKWAQVANAAGVRAD